MNIICRKGPQGHGVAVATHSPPTSEVAVQIPDPVWESFLPMVDVFSTEP